MPTAARIKFGDYLDVTDEGAGVIRVDGCPPGGAVEWADTGTGAEGGTGIQFETWPQTGEWLYVETTGFPSFGGDPPNVGIFLRASGGMAVEGSIFDVNTDPDGIHLISSGGGGTVIREEDGGGLTIESAGGGGLEITEVGGGGIDITSDADVLISLVGTARLRVRDTGGATIFRVDQNGDLHCKTGKSLVADL